LRGARISRRDFPKGGRFSSAGGKGAGTVQAGFPARDKLGTTDKKKNNCSGPLGRGPGGGEQGGGERREVPFSLSLGGRGRTPVLRFFEAVGIQHQRAKKESGRIFVPHAGGQSQGFEGLDARAGKTAGGHSAQSRMGWAGWRHRVKRHRAGPLGAWVGNHSWFANIRFVGKHRAWRGCCGLFGPGSGRGRPSGGVRDLREKKHGIWAPGLGGGGGARGPPLAFHAVGHGVDSTAKRHNGPKALFFSSTGRTRLGRAGSAGLLFTGTEAEAARSSGAEGGRMHAIKLRPKPAGAGRTSSPFGGAGIVRVGRGTPFEMAKGGPLFGAWPIRRAGKMKTFPTSLVGPPRSGRRLRNSEQGDGGTRGPWRHGDGHETNSSRASSRSDGEAFASANPRLAAGFGASGGTTWSGWVAPKSGGPSNERESGALVADCSGF